MATMDYSQSSPFSQREGDFLNSRIGVLTPGNSRKWRKALGNVLTGVSDAKILTCGDSTTAGVGVSGTTQGVPGSYPYRLASLLNTMGIPSAAGLAIPGHPGNTDSRFTLGTGWSNYGFAWGNNADYQWSGGVVGNLVFADSNVLADRFDVYYLTNDAGLGTVGITATGGSTVNQSTIRAGGGVAKVTVSAASAATSNTVTFVPANNGNVHIVGIEPWLSTTKKVRIGNAGVGGSRAIDHWNANNPGFDAITAIKSYAPDLTIISLGINDAFQPVSQSDYKTSIDNLIAAAQVSGDVILMSPIPSAIGAGASVLAYESLYCDVLKSRSLPYVDLNARFISGDDAMSLGYMADSLHPNALGYADIARLLANVITGV